MTQLTFTKLILKNFQSYVGEHELTLSIGGLVYVKGENRLASELTSNDCGKSTLFNALVWCLYGRTLRVARPGDSVASWNNDTGSPDIAVLFDRAGIRRTVRRTRSPNNLYLDGVVVEQHAVTAAIGLSYEAFIHCVVIGQFNELFLSLRPEEQTALFTELLDLDVWIKGVENATAKHKTTERRLEEADKAVIRYQGNLESIAEQIVSLTESRSAWQIKHQEELEKLQAALHKTTGDHQAVKNAVPDVPDVEEDEAAVADAKIELEALRVSGRAQLASLGKNQESLAKCESLMNVAKTQLNRYIKAKNVCPECGQTVTEKHIEEKAQTHRENLDLLLAQHHKLTNAITEQEEEIQRIDDEIAEIQNLIDEVHPRITETRNILVAFHHKVRQAELTRNAAVADFNRVTAETNPHELLLKQASARELELQQNIKKATADRDKLQITLGNIKLWVDSFKQIRLNLIDDTLHQLEFAVATQAEKLGLSGWRLAFETERETAKGEIRSKFTCLLYSPLSTEPVPLESVGGGVTQRCQLACVLGLSDVLLNRAGIACNLLVLDEPTRHLSEAGVVDLVECLEANSLNKTIFFIDHHSLEFGSFTATLNIIKDENGSKLIFM